MCCLMIMSQSYHHLIKVSMLNNGEFTAKIVIPIAVKYEIKLDTKA